MPLRLLEIYHDSSREDIEKILEKIPSIDLRHEKLAGKQLLTKIILPTEETEVVIDKLQKHFGKSETFRINIIPVEASIPRPEDEREEIEERISIEEIYQDLTEVAKISKTYLILVSLAAVVASIGLIRNDVAVIIGSMVIAPLLSPNMAIALATTLADSKLAKHAILTSIVGYLVALFIGVIFGMLMHVDITSTEISSRVNINLMYILLALSAGIAGSLSITKDVAQALVGVMVAVAILPPIVTSGLLIGSMHFKDAFGAFVLFAVNIVCINLAGILTFLIQGISPKNWWERKKAKEMVWKAILIWLILLLSLALLIIFL
ncbi:MAG: TIGR00341 family protein [Thermoplasmata archaeon]|nr:MAG: TIGR00341 family protein [Thermoplasmata archaeon]